MSKVKSIGKPEEEKFFTLNSVTAQIRFLQGRVLTIIDASIADKQQNKALKDVINDCFYEKLGHLTKMVYGEISCDDSVNVVEVSKEEMLPDNYVGK